MAYSKYPLLPKQWGFNLDIYPKDPVIYKIVNINNGKLYVGQTVQFRKRLNQHYHALQHNKHCSLYLQKSFNKHGVDSFYIEILEITTKELICEREVYWIEELKSYDKELGYNILINAPSPWYGKRSLQHCLNISKARLGWKASEETKKKQSEARIGRFTGKDSPLSIPIIQYDKNMNFIKEYFSVAEAAKEIGKCHTTVSECLVGRNKTAGGYIFKYKEVA